MSLIEGVAVVGIVMLALFKPLAFLAAFGLFVLLIIWLTPKIWRRIARFAESVRRPTESLQSTRFAFRRGPTIPSPATAGGRIGAGGRPRLQ